MIPRPIRLKGSSRFRKSMEKLGEPVAGRAKKALQKFLTNPDSPGLNFEAFKGRPGFFTIRVDRNFRILLKEETDEEGPYFLVVDVANHQETYR